MEWMAFMHHHGMDGFQVIVKLVVKYILEIEQF